MLWSSQRVCAAISCACLFASGDLAAQTAPTATVTGGEIKGVLEDGEAVFKGIPFAAPPVGDLRWRDPQAVTPWTGVREAAEFGAACMQGRVARES